MIRSSSLQYSAQQLKQAIEWFVQLQSEQCSSEDQARFESWLKKNTNHRAAYSEAESIWANMDDLKFIPIPGLAKARSAKPSKPNAAQLAAWAFVIFSTALLGGAWSEYSAETITYATRIGEYRRVDLADNSHIDLNTDTRVSVRMSFLQRNVILTQGEALFEVSHNRLRLFTVKVGDLTIRDIGTRFNVRKQTEGATISVLEGEVELSDARGMDNERLVAGNQRSYKEKTGLGPLKTVEGADQFMAWVNGQLVFKRTPLSEVTAELERYHPVQFTFSDQKLANETLSGTFDSTDIDPFLHALEAMLPVQAKRNGQQIQLRRVLKN